jgi:hypothetical protein
MWFLQPNYKEIHCPVIDYVKMEDFWRKAHFIAGGHTTDTPHDMYDLYMQVLCGKIQ